MLSIITDLLYEILKNGNKKIKILFLVSIIFAIIAISTQTLGEANIIYYPVAKILTLVFGISAILIFFGIITFTKETEIKEQEKKIEEVERKYEENPEVTKNAWDLARIKLESYLNRNLRQVRSIFLLSVSTMLIGFIILAYGIFKAYDNPENFKTSILVACSGILMNFLGGTFLLIYKSTMTQAKEYVSVLERINAVGMSIQILENIEDNDSKLKNQTSAELAKELLKLYGSK
ncbi:TRADD-N-associated membrane domain-containing protein [Tenacibaculum ovolyticum]|uniref:TRADD-N-associated membrane domain-containing protein n=1 Tax=Tenacibaculum ovolyticum TaxID=104270 RepID=UPI003BACDEA9